MDTKHTPGPWKFEDKPAFGERFVRSNDPDATWNKQGRRYICALPAFNKKNDAGCWEMMDANGRLIAAAPDLLAVYNAARALTAHIAEFGTINAPELLDALHAAEDRAAAALKTGDAP